MPEVLSSWLWRIEVKAEKRSLAVFVRIWISKNLDQVHTEEEALRNRCLHLIDPRLHILYRLSPHQTLDAFSDAVVLFFNLFLLTIYRIINLSARFSHSF